jgi:hypothetical protein
VIGSTWFNRLSCRGDNGTVAGIHYQALRAANRLVGILHGCLRTHTLYNEHPRLAQRTRQNQPCSTTASRRGMSSQPRLRPREQPWMAAPACGPPVAIAPRSTYPNGGVFESDECDRSRRRFGFRGRTCSFGADAVAQHQEWQPEEPKRVIGAQLAVRDVDIEFLFETRHPQCRQLA